VLEESGAFAGVVAEVVAEDTEGVGGVTEAAGGLWARQLFDKEGAQGLILALEGRLGAEEELGLVGIRYVVCSIDNYICIMLYRIQYVNNRWWI
jgi:hypothetical protein